MFDKLTSSRIRILALRSISFMYGLDRSVQWSGSVIQSVAIRPSPISITPY